MPDLATATSPEDKTEAVVELLDEISQQARLILRALTDREVVIALSADSDRCFTVTNAATPLAGLGEMVAERMGQIANLGRSFDQLCDPATLDRVV